MSSTTHFRRPIVEKERTLFPRNLAVWVPAHSAAATGQAMTLTRNAAGNTSMKRTAAGAETINQTFYLGWGSMMQSANAADASKGEVARGARINSVTVAYAVTVLDATSFTPTLKTAVHVDNTTTTPTITDQPLTGTLAVTARANTYLTTLTVTTPFVIDSTMLLSFDLVTVLPNTTVFEIWGVRINYDHLL